MDLNQLDQFAARSVGVTLTDFTSPRTPYWRPRRRATRRGPGEPAPPPTAA